ncbi:hypothetical protein JHK82_038915 [Glycine max]|nr:hypothetical protein JHK86_039092 [Glycine max]KAG5109692.1 hypothetical protein JHK82_038915 [Glycine max]KAG5120981.1 hypothetical protein JHK84_039321 [Glycine max]
MGELTQAEVYSPRTQQVWRALLSWLAFFFQIFFQIIRALGHYPLLSFSSNSSSSSNASSSSSSFKPLPSVEIAEHDSPPPSALEISPLDYSPADHPVPKLTVVLDLDETLVCAYETSSLPAALRTQAIEGGLNWFELECVSIDKEGEGKKINYVTVFERPGLKEFLKQLSEFADMVLFTAGLEGYARPLVDRIDVENRFSLRLYRPSTISTSQLNLDLLFLFGLNINSTAEIMLTNHNNRLLFTPDWEYREHVKDLTCISKDLCRIVIVDNNPFSFVLQPVNGIPCIPFSAGQPHDTQLLDVILPLLKQLSEQNDVRPFLYEKFHMPDWFQKQGIPASSWTL